MPGHEPFMGKPVSHDDVERRFDRALKYSFWTRVWHAILDVAACLGFIFR